MIPTAERPAANAETIVFLDARMRRAPLPARHLAAARDRKDAALHLRRELREEARKIARGADEAGGGRNRVGRIVAGNDRALAQKQRARMAARKGRPLRQR